LSEDQSHGLSACDVPLAMCNVSLRVLVWHLDMLSVMGASVQSQQLGDIYEFRYSN